MSGIAGQGGTVDFNTYLLRSGSRQGGHIGRAAAPHGQGHVFLQRPHKGTEDAFSNPSLGFNTNPFGN
jgi:hypothetical protein